VARIEADAVPKATNFATCRRAAPHVVLDLHAHVDHALGTELGGLLPQCAKRPASAPSGARG